MNDSPPPATVTHVRPDLVPAQALPSGATGRVALMSIRPPYAQAIMAGTKKVELRRRPLAGDVTHVLVYATAPQKRIIGAFTVPEQTAGTPEEVWALVGDVAGITKTAYQGYYRETSRAVAIHVGRVLSLQRPLTLLDLGMRRPPQSFQYLPDMATRTALAAVS